MSAALGAYRAAVTLAAPAAGVLLRRRLARGREDPERIGERLGFAARPRPDGGLVWIHAASVGEALAVLPVVEAIRSRPGAPTVLVTTVTTTAAALLGERLPIGALHQYVPIDTPAAVRGFLRHWRPDLAVWVESELWPTLLTETRRSGVPMLLLNGRMSDRSFRRWSRAPAAARTLLGGFALCLARSPEQAARLRALGALRVRCVGDLKDAAPPLPADPATLTALRTASAGRAVWVAASTHAGEEDAAATAHAAISARCPDVLTVIVPRHPWRGPAIASDLRDRGLRVALRSVGDPVERTTDVLVADTIGELGLFYRLASVAFVGGSLVPAGGHNLLEPARLGCAALHGPSVTNFAETASGMVRAGACRRVSDAPGLATAVSALLLDEAARTGMAEAARRFAGSRGAVLDAALAELAPFLDAVPGATRREAAG